VTKSEEIEPSLLSSAMGTGTEARLAIRHGPQEGGIAFSTATYDQRSRRPSRAVKATKDGHQFSTP